MALLGVASLQAGSMTVATTAFCEMSHGRRRGLGDCDGSDDCLGAQLKCDCQMLCFDLILKTFLRWFASRFGLIWIAKCLINFINVALFCLQTQLVEEECYDRERSSPEN